MRWTASAGAALIVVSPLIVLGWLQRGQLSWLVAPGFTGAISVTKLIGPPIMTLAVVIAFVVGVGVTLYKAREAHAPEWLTTLPGLTLPWLILPPAILLIGSAVTPVYNFRYILFCVPAAALLGGAGIAALGRIGATAALIVVAILGLNSQIYFRSPGGHGDDIRQADKIIAATAKPGDQVFYTNPNEEDFGAAYPYGLVRLPNIQLARQAIPSATLGGTNVSAADAAQPAGPRLAAVDRADRLLHVGQQLPPGPALPPAVHLADLGRLAEAVRAQGQPGLPARDARAEPAGHDGVRTGPGRARRS